MSKRLPYATSPEKTAEKLAALLVDFRKALEEIYNGAFPQKTLAKHGITYERQAFLRKNYDGFSDELARACEAGAAVLAERMVDITTEMENPGMARVASQNMQWYLERVHRKLYSPSVDVNVNQTISITGALAEARSRLSRLRIDPEDMVDVESVEESTTYELGATDYESDAPNIPLQVIDRNGIKVPTGAKNAADAEESGGDFPDIFS